MNWIRLIWANEKDIRVLADLLKKNQIILGSSDTVLGLIAILSKTSIDKLNKIKQRMDKPYIILLPSLAQAKEYSDAFNDPGLYQLAQQCWPGPLTLIVPAKDTVPSFAKAENNTVALRVPAHAGLQKLLHLIGGIFSTSANVSGKPVPTTLEQVDQTIIGQIAAIITNDQKHMQSSTILDCTHMPPKIVRQGAYPISDLEKIYGAQFINS